MKRRVGAEAGRGRVEVFELLLVPLGARPMSADDRGPRGDERDFSGSDDAEAEFGDLPGEGKTFGLGGPVYVIEFGRRAEFVVDGPVEVEDRVVDLALAHCEGDELAGVADHRRVVVVYGKLWDALYF